MGSEEQTASGYATPLNAPDLSSWRAGNTGVEGVWQFASNEPGAHILVSAIMHGNELCGAHALKDLLEQKLVPVRGTLTLMFCNLAAFDRFDGHRVDASRFVEQDMNRVWSDAVMAEGATLEARRAALLLPFIKAADWVLDLHSMSEPSAPLLLTGLQKKHLGLGRALGAPEYLVVDAGHKNGTRMRDYGDFGDDSNQEALSLLVECGQHSDPASHTVARDTVFRFLRASKLFEASALASMAPSWELPGPSSQWVLEVTEAITAKGSNFKFVRPFTGLEVLADAGTVIGSEDGVDAVTPYPDCVLVMPSRKQSQAGVTTVRLARREKLPASRL